MITNTISNLNLYLEYIARQGASSLIEERRRKLVNFILSKRHPDGLFIGNSKYSDIYYTSYALDCLKACNSEFDIPPHLKKRLLQMLNCLEQLDLVHISSLIKCIVETGLSKAVTKEHITKIKKIVMDNINGESLKDNIYAGIYSCFFATIIQDSLGITEPEINQIIIKILQIAHNLTKHYNTAHYIFDFSNMIAGLTILSIRYGIPVNFKVDIFKNLQRENGGFVSSIFSTKADLISTAVCSIAITALKMTDYFCYEKIKKFAVSLEDNSGGFKPDTTGTADIEYSFMGLLTIGCATIAKKHYGKSESL